MDFELVDPEEWDSGVWYDTYHGDYFTIEFGADEIRLVDIHDDTAYYTYADEEEFLDEAEEFRQLDPEIVANPELVVENALLSTYAPPDDAYTNIDFQYALEVTEITRRASSSVDRDRVEEAVVGALDAAYDEVPPDGRLPREKAKSVVVDAIESVAQD